MYALKNKNIFYFFCAIYHMKARIDILRCLRRALSKCSKFLVINSAIN